MSSPFSLNRGVFGALAFCFSAAYLLPYHVKPMMAFYQDWLAILGVAVAWLFFIKGSDRIVLRIPSTAVIPILLMLVVLSQASLGMMTYAWDAFLPVCYLLIAGFSVMLGATISAQKGGASRLVGALAATFLSAALLSVALASLQFMDAEGWLVPWIMPMPHEVGKVIRPYANMGQPNQMALLLCMGLASLWWLYQQSLCRTYLLIPAVFALIWGLTLTQSKTAWIILPVFVIAIVWLQYMQAQRPIRIWVLVTFLGLYFFEVSALPNWIAPSLGTGASTLNERIFGDSSRIVLLLQAFNISFRYPWFGAGWYEFGPQLLVTAPLFGISTYGQHAHNIVANFAAELGWPITVILLGLTIWSVFKSWFRCRIDPNIGFAWLLIFAVTVHSMLEYPLWYAYVLIPICMLIGLIHQIQFGSRVVNLGSNAAAMVFIGMAIGLVSIASDYRRLVVDYRAFSFETLGLKAEQGSTTKPSLTVFPQFYDFFRFTKMPVGVSMHADDVAFMERVTNRFIFPPVLMDMSLVYALNARPDDARRMMLVMNRLHGQHYSEAYLGWRILANEQPLIYADVFKSLPAPQFPKVFNNHEK